VTLLIAFLVLAPASLFPPPAFLAEMSKYSVRGVKADPPPPPDRIDEVKSREDFALVNEEECGILVDG
jgi:hypothetical protein